MYPGRDTPIGQYFVSHWRARAEWGGGRERKREEEIEKTQKRTETAGHLLPELARRHLFASQPNFQTLPDQPLLEPFE